MKILVGSGNKPRSWRNIKQNLEEISEKVSFSENDSRALFGNIRMYMESMKINNYPTLCDICNIMHHETLDHDKNHFPLRYLVNITKNPTDTPFVDFGLQALNWGVMLEELDQLIIQAGLPNEIIFDPILRGELHVHSLSLMAQKYFPADGKVYNKDGSINWTYIDKLKLRISVGFVYSFETSHFVSSTGLNCYGFSFEIRREPLGGPIEIRGLLGVGRCSQCNSPHVLVDRYAPRVRADQYAPKLSKNQNVAHCATCGFTHLIDNEVFSSAADPFYDAE